MKNEECERRMLIGKRTGKFSQKNGGRELMMKSNQKIKIKRGQKTGRHKMYIS